jgi:hypothetical protein
VIQRLSCDFRSHPTELSNFADDLTSAMRYSLTWESYRCAAPRRIDFRGTFMSDRDVPERQTTIRLLPTWQAGPGVLRRACKRPRCGNEIDPPPGRSRPREFCSDVCRNLYQRERDQARNVLMEARRLALQYEIDETATAEPSAHGTDSPEQPISSRGPSPSHLALALVAQTLESIRVDLQDGVTLDLEGVLARMTRAKEDGDRLLRTYGQNNRL